MPPHCDTMDGPVVKAAQKALAKEDVKLILPYVSKAGEHEVKEIFKRTINVINSKSSKESIEVAKLWFFENVVRIHRMGEGATYTGLKPAGLSEGPIIPIAERAIVKGSPKDLIKTMEKIVGKEVQKRFDKMMRLKKQRGKNVDHDREYVEAMLGLQVWSHKLYLAVISDPHEKSGGCSHTKEVHHHG